MRRSFVVVFLACVALACAGTLSLGRAFAAQHEAPSPHGATPESAASKDATPPPHAEHAAHGEHAGHGDAHALKSINWADFSGETRPYVIMLANFGLLVALYYSLGKKPIAAALKQRRASVAKEIEEAQRMKAEAEARAKQYQAKLLSLGEELETTKQALIEAGKGERDRIVKEAEEKADRMTKDAVFLLQQEVKQMRQDLVRETVEIAMSVAEELLKQKITPSDHERLADEYLSELLARPTVSKSAMPPRGGAS